MRVDRVSAHYRRERRSGGSLREFVVQGPRRWRGGYAQWHQVLSEVSFDLERGELLAVVGGNGAGKTTLLKVLAGIVPPSAGVVRVSGRVAPLIELGGGFDGDLTGRENAALFACLLGLSTRAARAAVDEVAEFAGLRDVMDEPLRTFSSGMIARLAFATATAVPSEILLVDEVLAVGDEEFRVRCLDRIASLVDGGASVMLVSHDLGLVERVASRALLLDGGAVTAIGACDAVLRSYLARLRR